MHNYDKHANVTSMLKDLEWPTLEQRPEELRIIIPFMIINQLVVISSTGLIIPSLLVQQQEYYLNLFFP